MTDKYHNVDEVVKQPPVAHAIAQPGRPMQAYAVPPQVVVRSQQQVVPPNLCCSHALIVILSALGLASLASTLVWPTVFPTYAVLLVFTTLLVITSMCQANHTSALVRPFAYFVGVAAVMLLLGSLLTWHDWSVKCGDRKDLSDRPLQAAYDFDCEVGIVLIVFWALGILMAVTFLAVTSCLGCSVFRQQDRFHIMSTGGPSKTRHVGTVVGIILSLIAVVVLMVSMFHGHPTGKVEGVCPKGDDFFVQPERNDLGCCKWTAKEGTCCHQTACVNKDSKSLWHNNTFYSSTCSDLTGLLSCSFCHPDAGRFAESWDVVRVCSSFCDQLVDNCCFYSDVDCADPTSFCEKAFNVKVVPDSPDNEDCFAAASQHSWVFAFALPLILALRSAVF